MATALSASHRTVGIAGLAGVVLNVVAVAALGPVPHTYRPVDMAAWWAESVAAPVNTTVSAWAFTIGLVFLAAWAVGLARATTARSPSAFAVGSFIFACGAMLDAAGTLLPIAAIDADAGVGKALLHVTLLLDASFNTLLGVGLLTLSLAAGEESGWPRALRGLGMLAGVVSIPVGLQFTSDTFARLLVVAGPLWLAFICWTSGRLLRDARVR